MKLALPTKSGRTIIGREKPLFDKEIFATAKTVQACPNFGPLIGNFKAENETWN